MAFRVIDENGPIISAEISGELSKSEVGQIQEVALKAIQRSSKISALFILENFSGWKRGEDWGDIRFLTAHDKDIAKIAVVGDEKWRDFIYAFMAKGFREAAVEFFIPADLAGARAWLEADTRK